MIISAVYAREILDSRGNPTVEACVETEEGIIGIASVPSGASTGEKEACELRDGDKNYCNGKGVRKAVENVNSIISENLIGMYCEDQVEIDNTLIELDETRNKSKLGANAILAVSLANADAASKSLDMPLYQYLGGSFANVLPCPMMNLINGGAHADNALDIQEFMIMPVKAFSVKEAIMNGATVFQSLKKVLSDKGLSTNVGDEGGFAPQIKSTNEAIEILITAIEKAGFKLGEDFVLALDCAASEFYNQSTKKYDLKGENVSISSDELIRKYEDLVKKYPIFSIEDPMAENDEEGWKNITKLLNNKVQIVGDDLFCTNPEILQYGINNKMANALLVKPNQIGTLTETIEAVRIAQKNNMGTILSHRSGETEDVKIAHIAVALSAGQIKTGSLSRSDRTAKYNELIRIEEMVQNAQYFGDDILKKFLSFR